MEINKTVVDRFLRTVITISTLCLIVMIGLAFLGVGHWSLWVSGVIACIGVIVSFGIHLNKLHNRPSLPQEVYQPRRQPRRAAS